MDILDAAFRNARIDAVAKARGKTKARGKDPTRKQRAKDANARDAVERASAWLATTSKRVRFAQPLANERTYAPDSPPQPCNATGNKNKERITPRGKRN